MSIDKMICGLQHIGLPTNDIDKTIDFYEGLGFSVAFKASVGKSVERVAFLRLGDIVIETYENGRAVGKAGAIDHICFDVTDIETAFSEITDKGYKLLDAEIQHLPFWERGVRFFTIEGVNGEKLEFAQIL